MFILVATLTRGTRFFLLAGLLSFFGHKILPYIEKFSGKIIIIILSLLFLGFYIAYLIYNNHEIFLN